MSFLNLAARLREPSTWAALAALSAAAGHALPADLVGAAPVLVTLGCAVAGVVLPEDRRPDAAPERP